jgi:hypothetical protein
LIINFHLPLLLHFIIIIIIILFFLFPTI